MSEVVAKLRQFETLADCSEEGLAELLEHSSAVNVPAHWAFILEGMPGDTCYFVLDGEVSIRRAGEEVDRAGPGELVGEEAILEQCPRTTTCVALTPLRLLEIRACEFDGWLAQRPRIRERLLAVTQPRPLTQ